MAKDKKIDWVEERKQRIDELSENFSVSKYNFLKMSFLKRLIEESYKNSPTCASCQNNLQVLSEMIGEIPNLDLIDHRSPYEKKFNSIREHFHKSHGFIQPYQFTTKWTLLGVLAGVVPAIIWSLIKMGRVEVDPVLMGSAFGLILGYAWGSTKDAKYRVRKKII